MASLIVAICVVAVGGLCWAVARLLTGDALVPTMLSTLIGCVVGAGLGAVIVQDMREAAAVERWCAEQGGTLDGPSRCVTDSTVFDIR